MELTVLSEKAVDRVLNLRIPSWCKAPRVSVNGKNVIGVEPGTYLKISRKWSKGDKVSIVFPMEERWVMREHHSKYTTYTLPRGEIMYKEEPTDRIPYTFLRGPMVYCLDMVWNKQLCNDDVDLAVEVDADGVHVGQHDMEAGEVRKKIGPNRILGVSAQTVEQALLAQQAGADYLGVGAVFPTGTKDDADAVSIQTLGEICRAGSIPVVAIGGIGQHNVMQLAGSGICGIAVVSAIYAQPDIQNAASTLHALAKEMVER